MAKRGFIVAATVHFEMPATVKPDDRVEAHKYLQSVYLQHDGDFTLHGRTITARVQQALVIDLAAVTGASFLDQLLSLHKLANEAFASSAPVKPTEIYQSDVYITDVSPLST